MSRTESALDTQEILDLPAASETDEGISDEQLDGCLSAQKESPFPRGIIFTGLLLVMLFVGIATAWAVFAPLEDAVVAPGVVRAAGHRKKIQHYEGGIVEKILVREGEQVKQGQVLLKLRDVRPAAELRQLERQHLEVQAIIARLHAELEEKEELEFPPELSAGEDPVVASVLAGQVNLFQSRRNLSKDKQSVLEQKIAQKNEEITGFRGRIQATRRERNLIEQELKTVDIALKKGLIPKAEKLKLQQRLAQIDDELIKYRADIQGRQQNIQEIRVQIREARAQGISDIMEELRNQREQRYHLEQKISAARDVLQRTDIVSPIEGKIVDLRMHTMGGVISAGQTLLEVVPIHDNLVISARIDPADIDEVKAGMRADIRLTAIGRRWVRPIKAVVADVSPDRIDGYFQARVEFDPDSLALTDHPPAAGMGADVYIRTGARSAIDYLFSPITRTFK